MCGCRYDFIVRYCSASFVGSRIANALYVWALVRETSESVYGRDFVLARGKGQRVGFFCYAQATMLTVSQFYKHVLIYT